MQNSLVDYSRDDLQKGFRLNRFEVYNWGTFHNNVWKIESGGFNSLLTGDIGSGKSTLVDALLTLLVPYQKIVYNKAAGAESRERNQLTYVLGEYKNERSEYNSSSSPVYLRQENDYSVLLARFNNKGFEIGYTLAQVLWIRNGAVDKFFVISKQDLNIKEHFTIMPDDRDVSFLEKRDISFLKKRLKNLDDTEVFDQFKEYSAKFRYYFGIKSEKVLELFHQTVSMKSVGKLTDFMRNHMLDKQDVTGKINEIKRNYDNLTKSHEAVQRAKKQLELLIPLDKDIWKYQDLSKKGNLIKKSIDFLPVFFSDKKSVLLEKEIQSQNTKLERLTQKNLTIIQDLERLNDQETSIHLALNSNKEGQMIAQLDSKMISLKQEKEQKYRRSQDYSGLCKELSFPEDPDEDLFHKSLAHANDVKLTAEADLSTLVTQRDGVVTEYLKLRDLC
ncbi:ATP-binding protein, partial [Methanocalculus sp.]|uniref:ATP-binding protein n=1 Tax=Methanocalculus sp. TaxID=2004547 RepID=UPI00260A7D69